VLFSNDHSYARLPSFSLASQNGHNYRVVSTRLKDFRITALNTQLALANELSLLIEKRQANQIGQWEFEESKRRLLKLPRSRIPAVIKNLLACLIVNLVLLVLAVAFPTYVKTVAVALFVVFVYLLLTGGHLLSKVATAGRRDGGSSRAVDWSHGMRHVAGTGWSSFGFFKKRKD